MAKFLDTFKSKVQFSISIQIGSVSMQNVLAAHKHSNCVIEDMFSYQGHIQNLPRSVRNAVS